MIFLANEIVEPRLSLQQNRVERPLRPVARMKAKLSFGRNCALRIESGVVRENRRESELPSAAGIIAAEVPWQQRKRSRGGSGRQVRFDLPTFSFLFFPDSVGCPRVTDSGPERKCLRRKGQDSQ